MFKKLIFDIVSGIVGIIYTIGEWKIIEKVYDRYDRVFDKYAEKYPYRFLMVVCILSMIVYIPYMLVYYAIKHKFVDKN